MGVKYSYTNFDDRKNDKFRTFRAVFGSDLYTSVYWPVQLKREPASLPPPYGVWYEKAPTVYNAFFADFRFLTTRQHLLGLRVVSIRCMELIRLPRLAFGIFAERSYSSSKWKLVHNFGVVRSVYLNYLGVLGRAFRNNLFGVDTDLYLTSKKYPAHALFINFEHYFVIREKGFVSIYAPYTHANKIEVGYQFGLTKKRNK